MDEQPEITDEERELVKGMPPAVAIGFIAAKRADEANPWRKLAEDLGQLQRDVFKY